MPCPYFLLRLNRKGKAAWIATDLQSSFRAAGLQSSEHTDNHHYLNLAHFANRMACSHSLGLELNSWISLNYLKGGTRFHPGSNGSMGVVTYFADSVDSELTLSVADKRIGLYQAVVYHGCYEGIEEDC